MTADSEADLSWHLGSVSQATPWVVNIDEPITDDEFSSHQTSAELIGEFITNSPFADLQRRYNLFKDRIEEMNAAFVNKSADPGMLPPIASALDDVLNSLRRFDDRTSHILSSRFGKESGEFKDFKQALSAEFDREFAYRFSWHLRNYSEHVGNVPWQLRETSAANPDGTTQRYFRFVVDSRRLLASYEWHRMVKADLERIDGEFPMDAVIDSLQFSCLRVYCAMLLSQDQALRSAIETIRSFSRRVNAGEGFGEAFIRAPADSVRTITVSPISTEIADVAEIALQQAKTMTT